MLLKSVQLSQKEVKGGGAQKNITFELQANGIMKRANEGRKVSIG